MIKNNFNQEELKEALSKLYGEEASKVMHTILPGILMDFQKVLDRGPAQSEIYEEYRLEDGKGIIKVFGTKLTNEKMTVDRILII